MCLIAPLDKGSASAHTVTQPLRSHGGRLDRGVRFAIRGGKGSHAREEVPEIGLTSEEKAGLAARALDAKKAREMVLLDLRGLTLMTDYFIICCGTSTTHVRTLADSVTEVMKKQGMGGIRVEGYDSAQWVLMDYGDVVVHVMDPEKREYYGLETFWSDAPHVTLDELPRVGDSDGNGRSESSDEQPGAES